MLTEDTHWKHFPADSSTLSVLYAPMDVPLPQLPYYKTTANLPTARLLINPGTNEFYQDCADELREIVATVSSGYRETIHYGYSQGGTGALDIGLSDPKCTAIFAMSPHFVLDRKWSRSHTAMTPAVLERPRANLLDRIRQCKDKDVYLFISGLDVLDGVQVRDARTLRGSPARLYFLLLDHVLRGVNAPDVVIAEYVATRCYTLPARVALADAAAQRESMLAFDIMAAANSKMELPEAVIDEAVSVANPRVAHWLGQYFSALEKFDLSVVHFTRACLLGPPAGLSMHDTMVCAGNVLARLGVNEMALGYYRQARKVSPRLALAWRCEANLLRALKRDADLIALADACASAGCSAEVVQAVRERAGITATGQ